MDNTTYIEPREKESRLLSGNFLSFAKKELIENRNLLILVCALTVGIYVLLGAFMGYIGEGGGTGEVFIFWIIAQILLCVVASMAFSSMRRKEGRIAELMIPATAFEKVSLRWIAAIPATFLLCVVGIYLGDWTRLLVYWATNGSVFHFETSAEPINPWVMFSIDATDKADAAMTFLFWSAFFLSQACYFFGAVLWPKYSILKTYVALWVIETMFGIAAIAGVAQIEAITWGKTEIITWMNIASVCACVLTVGLYVLTYWWYRRSTIISRL